MRQRSIRSIHKGIDSPDKQSLYSHRSSTGPTPISLQGNFLMEFDQDSKLIQRTEKKYEWTKSAFIKLFDEINELNTYKSALNDPCVKLWINEKGTPMYNKLPLMKSEFIFDARFSMESVV
jgi:hypothetical protein